jgi:hypothetical protein
MRGLTTRVASAALAINIRHTSREMRYKLR